MSAARAGTFGQVEVPAFSIQHQFLMRSAAHSRGRSFNPRASLCSNGHLLDSTSFDCVAEELTTEAWAGTFSQVEVPDLSQKETYRNVDYRRMIDWGSRLKREFPFLREKLGPPDGALVIDLGCGPGEHVRALTDDGYRALGLDSSASMLERAGKPDELAFFAGADIASLPLLPIPCAAGALCLGNTLVHMIDDELYRSTFAGLRKVIRPGGALIIQILNYVRLREGKVRHLPVNFREGPEGNEVIFLRLLDYLDDRRVHFEVVTLERPLPEEPVRLSKTTSTILRTLRFDELERFLNDAGFEEVEFFGSFASSPFDPSSSSDVIAVAQ